MKLASIRVVPWQLAAAAVLVCLSPAHGQQGLDVLTARDVFDLEFVTTSPLQPADSGRCADSR